MTGQAEDPSARKMGAPVRGRASCLRQRIHMRKTIMGTMVALAITAVAAACSSSYPGVTSPQPTCLERGQTCYYGTQCCSMKCLNNICVR